MSYNPEIHHRRSIRLIGYDYSQAGLYFVTICTQSRECLFGDINNNNQQQHHHASSMIEKWWFELPNKFKNIQLHEFIVMPNHIHGIIQINPVGADLCVCPEPNTTINFIQIPHSEIAGAHAGAPLHTMVQWFKTMTTNDYIQHVKSHDWKRFNGKLWQRNYHEHIIRDETSYIRIAEYIQTNPQKWLDDLYYQE